MIISYQRTRVCSHRAIIHTPVCSDLISITGKGSSSGKVLSNRGVFSSSDRGSCSLSRRSSSSSSSTSSGLISITGRDSYNGKVSSSGGVSSSSDRGSCSLGRRTSSSS